MHANVNIFTFLYTAPAEDFTAHAWLDALHWEFLHSRFDQNYSRFDPNSTDT